MYGSRENRTIETKSYYRINMGKPHELYVENTGLIFQELRPDTTDLYCAIDKIVNLNQYSVNLHATK